MKPWFRLTLVVCVLPCLLLNLTQAVALNHPLQVVGSGSWLDRDREPPSHAPPVSVVTSTAFDSDRAGPRRCTNGARSGSTRPREPWATGTYESMASCRSSQPLKPTPSSNPLHEITRFQ